MDKINKIKRILRGALPQLKKEYHIKTIGIFGSYIRGENRKGSDLDILVEFSSPIGLFEFLEMEEYLGKLLAVKVDLVSKNALKPYIGEHILAEVVYC